MTITIMLPILNAMQTKALEAALCKHSRIFSCEAVRGLMYVVLRHTEDKIMIQDTAEVLSMIIGMHLSTIAPDAVAKMVI